MQKFSASFDDDQLEEAATAMRTAHLIHLALAQRQAMLTELAAQAAQLAEGAQPALESAIDEAQAGMDGLPCGRRQQPEAIDDAVPTGMTIVQFRAVGQQGRPCGPPSHHQHRQAGGQRGLAELQMALRLEQTATTAARPVEHAQALILPDWQLPMHQQQQRPFPSVHTAHAQRELHWPARRLRQVLVEQVRQQLILCQQRPAAGQWARNTLLLRLLLISTWPILSNFLQHFWQELLLIYI